MTPDITMKPSAVSLRKPQGPLRTVEGALDRITSGAVVLCIAGMVAVIVASVVGRYVVGTPISWAEQVAKYLMIWAAFLGASLGVKEGAHVAVAILVDALPRTLRLICSALSLSLTVAFLSVTAWQGVLFGIKVSEHRDPLVWEMSMAWVYAAIPVGAVLMLVQLSLGVRQAHVGVSSVGANPLQ